MRRVSPKSQDPTIPFVLSLSKCGPDGSTGSRQKRTCRIMSGTWLTMSGTLGDFGKALTDRKAFWIRALPGV